MLHVFVLFVPLMMFSAGSAQAQPAESPAYAPKEVEILRTEIKQMLEEANKDQQQQWQEAIKQAVDQLQMDLLQRMDANNSNTTRLEQSLIRELTAQGTEFKKQIGDLGSQLKAQTAIQDADRPGENGPAKQTDLVGDRMPALFPWVAIGVSLLIAVFSARVSWWAAATSRTHNDTQLNKAIERVRDERWDDINRAAQIRTDDIKRASDERNQDIARANTLRQEDINRVETQRREDIQRFSMQMVEERERITKRISASAAFNLLDQRGLLDREIAEARGFLKTPLKLTGRRQSLVVKIGNWYEKMARRWEDQSADRSILEKGGLTGEAKLFLNEVLAALILSEEGNRYSFQDEIGKWQTIASLPSPRASAETTLMNADDDGNIHRLSLEQQSATETSTGRTERDETQVP